MLALEIRSPVTVGPASLLWRSRCQSGRIVVSREHDNYPALLAEALDNVLASGLDLKTAAEALACTPSQLLKLLKGEPRAFALLNELRGERGIPRLR
jgi:hypothetical protein